jgi:hypothetical protein
VSIRRSAAWLALLFVAFLPAVRAEEARWNQKMREMRDTLSRLILNLSSDERFESSANRAAIDRDAERLAKIAHELKPAHSGKDPGVQILAGVFAEEADRAVQTLKRGSRGYGRTLVRSMTGYCVACHTRDGSGPYIQGSVVDEKQLAKLRPLERADLHTALRQFDRGFEEYQRIASDAAFAAGRPFEWELAVRSGLALSIRTFNDPDKALGFAERVIATPKAPGYFKEQAVQWKKDIAAWKEEASSTPKTDEGRYAQAVKLMAEALSAQKYPADRSVDVRFLRAGAAAHEALSAAPNGPHAADALFLAGLSYEVLRNQAPTDLHEFFYAACIKRAPHTETARRCFHHYEQSVFFGFTGSGGTNVPDTVRDRLNELNDLAQPEKKGPQP